MRSFVSDRVLLSPLPVFPPWGFPSLSVSLLRRGVPLRSLSWSQPSQMFCHIHGSSGAFARPPPPRHIVLAPVLFRKSFQQVNSSELREGRRPESVPKMTNSLECSFRLEPYHGHATHKGGLIGRWNKAHNVTAWRTEGLHRMMERPEQWQSRASTDKLARLRLTCDDGEEEDWKRRRRRRGAGGAICRHSAHSVPCKSVGHVKIAPSITPRSGQLEGREAKRERTTELRRQRHTAAAPKIQVWTLGLSNQRHSESLRVESVERTCKRLLSWETAYPNCLDESEVVFHPSIVCSVKFLRLAHRSLQIEAGELHTLKQEAEDRQLWSIKTSWSSAS